jgi:DNA modification methylase
MEAREELVYMTKTNDFTWHKSYTNELSKRNDLGANKKPRSNEYKRCSDVWTDIPEACHSPYQRFKLPDGTNFPTVKALALCKRIIEASSNPGDLVYVPFAGAGSEMVAACELDRKCIGTEINENYIESMIVPRLSKINFSPIDRSYFEKDC